MGTSKQLTKAEKKFILKVASLIEEGSTGMIQITGNYIKSDGTGCCAMGAVWKAIGWIEQTGDKYEAIHPTYELRNELGANEWPRIPYPKGGEVPFAASDLEVAAVIDVVIFLNDRLFWNFQRIIAYLRDATLKQPKVIGIKP